ncbi:GNAT family N-acetyltransferase [Sinorhizobium meliloti]|uniref:GNAT family N-acetyltransferase n=1 Tax=Rhizobium meliloti TaxID=382 RepID=UPI000480AD93|nr:GNAT family N-acetyltransferase [Sinorhizobium meliloti]
MDGYELCLVENADDWAAYHRIRRTILFEARGRFDYIPDGPEELKAENLSLLLKYREQPIGTVRLDQKPNGKAIVRLVAIVSHLQKQGHGTALMQRVEKLAASLGFNQLLVHAALDAVGFYQKLGYSRFDFEKRDIQSVQLHKLI